VTALSRFFAPFLAVFKTASAMHATPRKSARCTLTMGLVAGCRAIHDGGLDLPEQAFG